MEGLPSVNADISGGSALPSHGKSEKEPEDVDKISCKCKRSKCLKKYCECFSAGLYCSEVCECNNCVNSRDYEDSVLDVCEKIRSRNPDAFKFKILQAEEITESSTSARPLIARHKRGCKCKRSMCMKKYCKCHQAGVACSPDCQCEDCKNTFGKKNETGEIPQLEDNDESLNTGSSGGNIRGTDLNNNLRDLQSDSHVFQSTSGSDSLVQQSQFPLRYPKPSYLRRESYLDAFRGNEQASVRPFYANNLTSTIVEQFGVGTHSGEEAQHRYDYLVQQPQPPLGYYTSPHSISSLMPPYLGSESYLQAFQGREQASVRPFHANSLRNTIVEQFGIGTHSGGAQHRYDYLVLQPQPPMGYYTSPLLNPSLSPPYLGSESYLQASQGSEQASVGPFYGNNSRKTIVEQFGEGNLGVKPNSGEGGHQRYEDHNP